MKLRIKVDLEYHRLGEQYRVLKALLDTGTVEVMEIDTTGIGGFVADLLREKGYKQVKGV